jgi:transcriptional regulator with XRE-family HTH domain
MLNPLEALRSRVERAESQASLARELGVSPQYLNDVLAERRPPSERLLAALGIEIVYRRKRPAIEAACQ